MWSLVIEYRARLASTIKIQISQSNEEFKYNCYKIKLHKHDSGYFCPLPFSSGRRKGMYGKPSFNLLKEFLNKCLQNGHWISEPIRNCFRYMQILHMYRLTLVHDHWLKSDSHRWHIDENLITWWSGHYRLRSSSIITHNEGRIRQHNLNFCCNEEIVGLWPKDAFRMPITHCKSDYHLDVNCHFNNQPPSHWIVLKKNVFFNVLQLC